MSGLCAAHATRDQVLRVHGLLGALLLHVPIGIEYLRAVRNEDWVEPADWKKSGLYTVAFAAQRAA